MPKFIGKFGVDVETATGGKDESTGVPPSCQGSQNESGKTCQ
jgi:hypothetical protein